MRSSDSAGLFRLAFLRAPGCALALCLWIVCVSGAPRQSQTSAAEAQAQIRRRLDQICDAVAKKDFPRLDSYHAYGPKFTKFGGAPVRLDAAAAREGEHKGIAAVETIKLEPQEVKIDVFDNVGIITMTLKSAMGLAGKQVENRSHATLVLVNEGGDWKIVHEHFSPVDGPR